MWSTIEQNGDQVRDVVMIWLYLYLDMKFFTDSSQTNRKHSSWPHAFVLWISSSYVKYLWRYSNSNKWLPCMHQSSLSRTHTRIHAWVQLTTAGCVLPGLRHPGCVLPAPGGIMTNSAWVGSFLRQHTSVSEYHASKLGQSASIWITWHYSAANPDERL